ncbi:MAG: hypothetical protein K9M57_00100 [Phycisphaerae bacterium]|nr:hypothetical protein [Phycisphaerae bacterium]
MRPHAFSVLELIVTLTIVALLTVAVLGLLNGTTAQSARVNQRMEQMGAINMCMDRLMDDVIKAAEDDTRWHVKKGYRQQMKTSHLTIQRMGGGEKSDLIWQIDWIATPSEDGEDLTLYRREKTGKKNDETDVFIPLCEHLYSFDVQMINEEGLDDPNAAPAVIQVKAELFRMPEHEPDFLLPVNQTYCLRRFGK